MYGGVPLFAVTVASPSLLPQVAELVDKVDIIVGWVMETLVVLLHPFTSKTDTVYVPALNPVTVIFVCTGTVLHEYVKGDVPPETDAVAEPSLPPLHETFVCDATETVGVELLVMMTSSVEGVQTPLEIVHRKVFAPTPSAVSPDVGEVGVVMVPLPEISVHIPVPTVGVFAARVVEVVQRF